MNLKITPGTVNGTVTIPPSKSLMQRACAASLLHVGTTHIYNPGYSDDDKMARQIIEQLGAIIQEQTDQSIKILSHGIQPVDAVINCGQSGLCARLFTPIAALSKQRLTVTGQGSLLTRPMDFFENTLQQLNVSITATNGRLPIQIQGPLLPSNIMIDGSLSSQFLTGLLFACAFAAQREMIIEVMGLKSKPYIDLTLDMLKSFGRQIRNDNYERFYITPVEKINADINITLEADWSSAGYWIVAGLLTGDMTLKGLHNNSLQADKAILEVVRHCGGTFHFDDSELHIKHTSVLNFFNFDATDCPDLFPVLSILAARCNGTSSIKGLNRLVHKESNRIKSITSMLDNFNVPYKIDGDRLQIEGVKKLKAATMDSYHDHRIAMAASVGALVADGNVTIEHAECVSKSYPDFFKHLEQLGINTTYGV